MERAAGIEPACLTWKDSALPLSYARADGSNKDSSALPSKHFLPIFAISANFLELSHYPRRIHSTLICILPKTLGNQEIKAPSGGPKNATTAHIYGK